ncbi:pilus assembly protein FimV [Marinomonas sp. SBI22]|uniref:FimV/HubP family polar landmark protein n=1 Tax=unclassified Marinomonas TaxID=196814 RepID=UPI0007AFC9DD|nr:MULTISPECIES: FimV/HubP family polar landmark protein [unclassified Marinomonas]KZM45101.1 pilus assembly protein FimV [Marinomonas sp. SBI22]KZM46799.1 pilus assembly protein FimV [Marinomonas sp. SBI8L]
MLKKTLVSIAVASTLSITSAHALELGELTAISKADEPFKAEIQLLDVNSLKPNEVRIRLGSESEFRQAEIVPNRILSRLRFQVRQPSNGKLVIDVVSRDKLDVDNLDFVLSARWPSGKVVRGYKVPLKESVLVESGGGEVVQSSKVAKANNTINRTTFVDARSLLESMPTEGTYTTSQGNTLWSLADRNKPNNQLTVYQTMMAIQALNEDAFYANNINLMKEGAILRLPTKEQIALFNKAMSKQEFEKQNQAWMDLKRNGRIAKQIESAQLNTQANSKPASKVRGISEDTLSLIAGASVLPEGAASSNDGGSEKIAKLEQELSSTKENLDKESREKVELGQKLNDLNSQLATLEELISLKDAQLAELQQQFMSAQNALQEQKNTVDQLLEADQLRREKEMAEEASFVNRFFGNPIFVSIASVLLLVFGFLIGFLIKKSGKKKEEGDELSDFDLASESLAPVALAEAAVPEMTPEPEKEEEDDDPFSFDFDGAVDDDANIDTDLDMDIADDPFAEDLDANESVEETPAEDESFGDEAFGDDIFDDSAFADDLDLEEAKEEVGEDFGLDIDDVDDLEVVDEEDIPTIEPEPELEEDIFDDAQNVLEEDDVEDSEEADFVNNLLNDTEEQDDIDETAIFDEDPNESLANSIEESLTEAQSDLDDDLAVPSFTEEDAKEDDEASDEEEEFDFFDASGDEVATKLDLARAYMDMGDEEGARVILEDVLTSGNEAQVSESQSMIDRMSPSE